MINHVFGLAVRVLLYDDNGKILILKRSTDSKTNPGKWELPGGKVDQGESFDQALIREVFEETGLKIFVEHFVGASEQNLHVIRAIHIIMSGRIMEGELKLSEEHEGYAWVFFEELADYELADWLNDYFINQTKILSHDDGKETEESENALQPWLNSVKGSIDNLRKR